MNGLAFNLDDSFLKTLAEVDKQMSALLKKKTKFSKGIVESFQEISKNGVEPFIKKLNENKAALDAISKVPIQGKASAKLKKLQSDAASCADKINTLVTSLQGLRTNVDLQRGFKEFDNVQRVNQLYSERILYMRQLEGIVRKGMTGELVNPTAVSSQISTLQQNLQVIESEIRRYNSLVKHLSKDTIQALTKGETNYTLAEDEELKKRIDARKKASDKILQLEQKLSKVQKNIQSMQNTTAYKQGDAVAIKSYNDLLAREQDLQNKIASMRNNLGKITQEVENRYAAQTASENLRIFQDEQDKKAQIARERMAKQLEESKKYGTISSSSALRLTNVISDPKNIAQDEAAIEKLKNARKQLDKNDANYQQTLAKLNEEIAKHEHNIKMATDATYRKAQADKTINQQNTTYQGAMAYSQQTKSINEQKQAIEYLKQARDKLDKTSMSQKDYEKAIKDINKEIKRQQDEIDKLTEKQGKLKNSQSRLMNTSDQLQRKLALMFSVSAIQGYMNKLVEVRKEFELQQKSLQILLKDKDEADKLWQQTLDLAVKSPFRVKELVNYTKQLAAYRIETSKLHQTTKMLSDVSAGLGVDMQRIILAFGQVRAAQFLRGTELRQFTEAGIPMLDELANLFSDLEGRAVSTGEVFERISKRMVLFKDVEQVFERMTSASGIFYKMQEEQSKTLAGMISNLHDSMDIMLNDIGKANEKNIKDLIQMTRTMIDNWRMIGVIIKEVGAAFLLFNLSKFAAGWRMAAGAISMADITMKGIAGTAGKLRVALSTLFATIAANPFPVILAATGAAAYALWEYSESIDAVNKKYDEMSIREVNVIDKLEALNEKAQKNNTIIEKSNDANEERNKAEKENIKILNEIKSKYPELANLVSKQTNGTIDLTKAIEAQNEQLIENIALQQKAKGGWFYDSLDENYKDAIEDFAERQSEINSIKVVSAEAMSKLSQADISTEDYKKFSSLLAEIRKSKDFDSLQVAYNNFTKEVVRNGKEVTKQVPLLGMFAKQWLNVVNAAGSYKQSIKDLKQSFERQKDDIFVGITDAYNKAFNKEGHKNEDEAKEAGANAAGAWIEGFLDDFGIIDENIREWAKIEIPKFVTVDVLYPTKVDTPQELEPWAKRVKEAITKVNDEIKKTNPNATQFDLFPLPDPGQTREQYLNIAKSVLDIAKATYAEGQQIEDEATVNRTKMLSDYADDVEKILNIIKKETTKGAGKDWMSEVIKGVKEAHQEYLKLSKTLDSVEAKQMALDKYEGVFNEAAKNANLGDIKLGDLTFETEEGAKDALRMLKDLLPESAKNARLKIEEALAEIEGEVRIKTKVEQDKQILDSIEEMFGNYEISLELQKLNIPPDLAKKLFGVDPIDLSSIRSEIENKLKSAMSKGGQEDLVKDLKEQLEKVDEMEDKALQERLKKYSKYLTTAMGERVKIKMEEIRAISEIENTKEFSDDQKELAKQGVRKESQAKLDKLEWEEFKDSGMYVQLFEDLEYASTKSLKSMRTQLEQLKGSLKNLDADDLRHLYNQIEKLDDVLVKRNPFKTFINGLDDYRNAIKNTEYLDKNLESAQEEYNKAKKDERVFDLALAKQREEYNQKSKNNKLTKQENDTYLHNIALLENQLKLARNITEKKKEGVEQAQKEVDTNNKTKKTFKEAADEVGKYISQAANALPEIAGNLENVFGSMDAATRDAIDSIAEIGGGIGDTVQAIANKDVIGTIVGLSKTIGAIFAVGDKKKERQIQKEIEFVDKLGRAYEKLQKQIEDAYSINTLQQSGKNAKANLEAQIASYRRMISAEEDKKKTDKNRIKEWEYAIEDIQQQIEDMNKDLISTATAGIMDSVLSASQEFTDAWLSAFQETGDGLSGLESNFKETMLEMVKQQAAMLISQSYVERWKKQLEQYVNPDDLELSTDEAKKWVNAVTTSLPQLNEALENYFNAMQQAGVDLSGGTGDELSGLQRGIQGVTEETAQIIEAYLNSIRFFVAENNNYLAQIASSFNSGEMENPMVSQLRIIAQQTSAINTLLNSLTKGGHSLGGVGLKVFIS